MQSSTEIGSRCHHEKDGHMFNVNAKVTLKKRIIVNSHEYAGPEDMPDELRKAYEAAMAKVGPNGHAGVTSGSVSKIIFNGREYADEESMPPEERRLYDAALASLKAEPAEADVADPRKGYVHVGMEDAMPIEPSGSRLTSSRSKAVLLLAGAFALLLILYALNRGF